MLVVQRAGFLDKLRRPSKHLRDLRDAWRKRNTPRNVERRWPAMEWAWCWFLKAQVVSDMGHGCCAGISWRKKMARRWPLAPCLIRTAVIAEQQPWRNDSRARAEAAHRGKDGASVTRLMRSAV